MKLSKRITFILLIIFTVVTGYIYMYCRTFLLDSFEKIEVRKIIVNMNRIENYIKGDIKNISNFNREYSVWDFTYEFMKNKSKKYLDSNFTKNQTSEVSLKESNVNFMVFIDLKGNIVKKLKINDTSVLNKDCIEDKLIAEIFNIISKNDYKEISGLVKSNNIPVIISAQPILKTNGSGPPSGVIILGKVIDNEYIEYASGPLKLSLNLDYDIKSDYKFISENIIQLDTNREYISSGLLLRDLSDNPIAIIKVDTKRDIYNEALDNINFFMSFILLLEILIIAILVHLINKLIIKRIMLIRGIAHKICETNELSLRLDIYGDDEITDLSIDLNEMFNSLQKSRNQILNNKEKYQSLFTNLLSNFLYVRVLFNENLSEDLLILEANKAFLENFKIKEEDIIGKKASNMLAWLVNPKINILNIINSLSDKNRHKKIEEIYIDELDAWYSFIIYNVKPGFFALIFEDISERKIKDQTIINLAYYDTLTGLPNRKMIMEAAEIEVAKDNNRFALFFIDLDNFKNINDCLGHDAGDFILKCATERLKPILEDKNIIIGRIGGDEFVVLKKQLKSLQEAEDTASDICSMLSDPFIYRDNELYIGASIGICTYPEDGKNLSLILKNADIAMYHVKSNGGGGYKVYDKGMNERALEILMMENNLRKALDRNEFEVFYQPIINTYTGKIGGAEALIRWRSQGKLIAPSEFITLAKRNGEIVSIDKWVIKTACNQCKKWHDDGLNIYISVNISFKLLKMNSFVEDIITILNESKLEARYLSIEITEDEAMEDVELVIEILNKIKSAGINVSLDDFGTGYSSLSYVNRLPINILKIDKSMVRSLNNNRNIEIVRAIIAMAHSLNISVVTEGVEHAEQFEKLKELQSDLIQGYIISKPLDTTTFNTLYLDKHRDG